MGLENKLTEPKGGEKMREVVEATIELLEVLDELGAVLGGGVKK